MSNPVILRSSSIADWKACPQKYRLRWRQHFQVDRDPAVARIGSYWGELHEHYGDARAAGQSHDDAVESVMEFLEQRYSAVPDFIDYEPAWWREREVLQRAFLCYHAIFEEDPVEILASELKFQLPMYDDRGQAYPEDEVILEGHIDHIVAWNGRICVLERKSTGDDLSPTSKYWRRLRKDTQVSMYAMALRELARRGELPEAVMSHPDYRPGQFGNTLYDVWRRPQIKPKALTLRDSATLLDRGEYCNERFDVRREGGQILVDGSPVEYETKPRGVAIYESIEMFGARLACDFVTDADRYFARQEVVRTTRDLEVFARQLPAIYAAMQFAITNDSWYENERQCDGIPPCPFRDICYGAGADAVVASGKTPHGYKREVLT